VLARRTDVARVALVTSANIRDPQTYVSDRSDSANFARNDLHRHLRSPAPRTAPAAHRLPASRPPRAHVSYTRHRPSQQIPNKISIHLLAPEIEDRVMPGHREGDFIKGEGIRSSVGVLVERSSRLVLLAKMDNATAESALAGFSAKLNSIPEHLRHSFTYDQGPL
jgi:IS30 family transposase